jgi:hypothetical protein
MPSLVVKKIKELDNAMDTSDARRALAALGIVPTKGLIRAWLQAARGEELSREDVPSDARCQPQKPSPTGRPAAVADSRPRHPLGYSKSQLEPVLRTQGTLERQQGRRKRGRPRIVASWFSEVAETMADGTPLRSALQRRGISLDKSQIRALYRNREFKRMYQEWRGRCGRRLPSEGSAPPLLPAH